MSSLEWIYFSIFTVPNSQQKNKINKIIATLVTLALMIYGTQCDSQTYY